MQIFIDESGNLGVGDRYFVIAALIPHSPKRIKNLVRRCCVDFGTSEPLEELKASRLQFDQKQEFLKKLTCVRDFDIAYIVADKKRINPKLLASQNICFNYLLGKLLQKVITGKAEDIIIMCDNRNIKVASGNSLSDYLKIKAYSEWSFGHQIQLSYSDSRACHHLQAVDIVANAVYASFEKNKHHFFSIIHPHIVREMKFPYQTFGS